jgi:cell division inhibitor SepF
MKERKAAVQEIFPQSTTPTNNIVSLQAAMNSKGAKVVLVEPRVYAEAQDIAEHLKNKRATIVNLQRIEREQGVRIIDFLSGTVYALAGDIQRIGKDIFLCTPENVEVSGEISNFILDDN